MAGPAAGRIRHPVLRAFVRAPGGLIGAGLLLGLLVLAVVGPMIWGHPATVTDLNVPYQVHSPEHPLGTDSLGRDVLARTLSATRLTLVLGLSAAAISAVVGFGIGTAVAALGPRARGIGRRAIESSLSFPPILLALFLVAIIGAGARGAVIAIGLGAAPGFARLAENFATSVGSREFIASAKATGVGRVRLMQRYLLPNMAEPLVLAGLAYVAGAIIDISGLDFLGLGVQPPAYDWGTLLTAGVQSIYVTPFAGMAPAFMIMLTGTSLVFFGEALSRALNPRLWVTGPRRDRRAERARAGRAGKAGLAGPAAARPAPATGAADPAGPVVADAVVADAVVVENLRITLPSGGGPRALVDGVSFRLRAGEVLGIVGESGSGKTLTSLAIGQLLPHPLRTTATRIELGGTELTTLPPGRLARVLGTGLAMIFQDPMSSMNPASRAGSQLTDGARRHRGLSREEARAEAVQRLGEVRIGDARRALRRYPHQFSGGMQQRIMIAMGLMARPRVLIADEPTTALDVTVQAQVLEVLRDINASEGTAIILISHNLGVINQLCDRVLVMYAGRVVEEGDRERLLADPQHPYTKALLASVPVLPGTVLPGTVLPGTVLPGTVPSGTSPAAELKTIPGRPPRPDEDVPGCSFAARCPLAISRCTAERPALTAAAAGGKVACFVVTGAITGEAVR